MPLNHAEGGTWALYHGDCVEVTQLLPTNSIGYLLSSLPFESLLCYSDSDRDFGNSRNSEEFAERFKFLVPEIFRIMKPGRLTSWHCMNFSTTLGSHGYIAIRDFRGDVIRLMLNNEEYEFWTAIERLKYRLHLAVESDDSARVGKIEEAILTMNDELTSHPLESGFYFHSEVLIWKDPLIDATRTHAVGLSHGQAIVKDGAYARMGLGEHIITLRKPGKNEQPIAHPQGLTEYYGENPPKGHAFHPNQRLNKKSHHIWQRYASPCWMDISRDTLYSKKYQDLGYCKPSEARDEDDTKHVCAAQTDAWKRCIDLWSNPDDIVFDPFNGIGTTGVVAREKNRKYVGIELKETYWKAAKFNLENADRVALQDSPLLQLLSV